MAAINSSAVYALNKPLPKLNDVKKKGGDYSIFSTPEDIGLSPGSWWVKLAIDEIKDEKVVQPRISLETNIKVVQKCSDAKGTCMAEAECNKKEDHSSRNNVKCVDTICCVLN